MFIIRPYTEQDAAACGECLYEGFFSCPIGQNDRIFLRDYAQVLIEKCNFTYVAQTEDRQIVGFICGKYNKKCCPALAGRYDAPKHYGVWCRMFLKFYLKRYKMSAPFQTQFASFYRQLLERDNSAFDTCELELVALTSKAAHRQGLGTALVARFLKRAEADGAATVRLLTNTLASWEFYKKRGFTEVSRTPFKDGSSNSSIVYEYRVSEAR